MTTKLIYLDQCAACEMALNRPPWIRLRGTREKVVEEGRSLCPLSRETVCESSPCGQAPRVALSDFFDRVSGGWLIKCFDELIAEETVQLVRGQDIHVLARYSNLIPVESGHATITRMAFETAKTAMEGRAAAFTYQPCQIGIPIEEVRKNTNLERAGRMFRDIERLIAKQTTEMEVPAFAADLIKARFTEAELRELSDHIIHRRW